MCDTMVIVQADRVLFAKNSDRDPNEAQVLDWQPRRGFPSGARLKCTWIEIPQARETHAVLLSRPYWMWGAEIGANEHGVTIGNEAVFTKQPYAATGLTGMDLLRLALERAATAEAAVQTILGLLEEFGQGGSCSVERPGFTYHNSFIVADPRSAFVLETAGKKHAVEPVQGARSISNGLTIPGFAERYRDTIKGHVAACWLRQHRSQSLVARADGAGAMMAALRDHGAGQVAPRYSWLNGGLRSVCVHAGGLVASSQTTASWVAELKPGATRHWATATAAPCTSVFKPVAVAEPLDLGPLPTNRFDPRTLWWRHELLHRRLVHDPERLGQRFRHERDQLEATWRAAPPTSQEAFAAAEAFTTRWTTELSSQSALDLRPGYVRRLWSKRNASAGFQPLASLSPVTNP